MSLAHFVARIISITLAVSAANMVYGQIFPTRPVRVIAPLPGGTGDFAMRLVSQEISGPLGQPVIVENRPSSLTGETAMKAQPDGYTLLIEGSSFWITPLMQKTPYDVELDFSPITQMLMAPNILVVHPSITEGSLKDLIALAKAKPGHLNYGSSGTGSSQHLGAEMLKSMTGINMVHIPYKGIGPAVTGLIAGEVQVISSSAASVAPHIKSGKLRALAVTGARPSALFPGLPTVESAAGLPGYDVTTRTGLFAAGKPPRMVINRLNQEIVRALNKPEVREKFLNQGVETVGNSPEEFAATIKSEIVRMRKVINDAGIRLD